MAQGGMTPQYLALRKLLHTICSSLSKTPDSIPQLANDLNGEGLIPDTVSSAVQYTVGVAPYNQASRLVTAVHGTIRFNTDKFYVFAEKLDEHGFTEISKKLLEKCVELGGKGPTTQEEPAGQTVPVVKPKEEIGPKLQSPTQEEGPTQKDTSATEDTPQGENKIRFDSLFKKKHVYDITCKADHGIALIINNKVWPDKPNRTRHGSELDVETFKDVVDHFKYSTTVKCNLTAAEMKTAVEDAGKAATPNHDSLICCIMSHGDNEGIEGVDGKVVKVAELTQLIGPEKCANLVGKPKIFILQACRGQKIPEAIQFDSTTEPEEEEPSKPDEDEIQFDSKVMAIPPDADYFYAYCTTPSTMSMRRPSQGAFYIQILCEKLQKKAGKMSLHDIVLRVHDKLATDDVYAYTHPKTGKVYRQMGQVVSTLRKKVFFS